MKRAQGHVEVMLSFVIFIGFLLFTFIFLNPFARTEEPNYVMDNIQKAIINNITDEVGKLSIILNESGTCYKFNETDYEGDYLEANEGRKYVIYFSNMFDNTETIKENNCNPSNYTLGLYSKEEMIIYNKILDLKNGYEGDYDNLKESLGITNDFLFKTKNLIGEEVPELSVNKNVPGGIDVESREIPIRVINNSGQIKELILNIRAW
ncbi:MAG: hypothetical protein Q8N63_08065 [Nanoarchaeota archaeon]|nr:hypothetical protein [Nanoarchaeota archaeon]